MLTHKIDVHKSPEWEHRPHHRRTWAAPEPYKSEAPTIGIPLPDGGMVQHVITKFTPKIHYARWLATLPHKRGDWVVHEYASEPYNQHQFSRVRGLQEAQFLLTFDHKQRPLCLLLKSHLGTKWEAAVENYRIIDPALVPEECKFDLDYTD